MEEMNLDTTQEVRIVVLQNKVERLEEKQVELLDRLRTVEKWVAGAAAIIAGGVRFPLLPLALPGDRRGPGGCAVSRVGAPGLQGLVR